MHNVFQQSIEDFCFKLEEIEDSIDSGRLLPEQCLSELMAATRASCRAINAVERQQGADLESLKLELRQAMQPWFSKSWFLNRALEKPRGYPGDFDILEGIYDNRVKSSGIGEVLDLYFLQKTIAQAVRNRKDKCRELIQKSFASAGGDRMRVLNIACGPCREIRELAADEVNRHLSFVGIDHDEAALLYAHKALNSAGISDDILSFRNQNISRMISAQKNVEMFGVFDLIYSVGLYDYLPDKALIHLLRGTSAMLSDEGRYIVAFKDCEKYDKTEYQWHVDWYFQQRTEQKILSLVEQSGLRVTEAERDASGIVIFLTLKKE